MGSGSVGIALGNGGADAVFRRGSRHKPDFSQTVTLTGIGPLLVPLDKSGLENAFAELARQLPKRARRLDVPVYIGLPDPLVHEDFLEFRDFPNRGVEAQALVAARIAREHQCAVDARVCSHQLLGKGGEGIKVLVRSIDRRLRDAVEKAAMDAGLHVLQIEAHAAYKARQAQGRAFPPAYAAVWISSEAWSLECAAFGADGFYSESGWIRDEHSDARLIVRLMRSFSMSTELESLTAMVEGETAFGDRLIEECANSGIETIAMPEAVAAVDLAKQVAQWR